MDVKKRFTDEQIIGFLKEADAGVPVKDLCRRHGFSEGSYYLQIVELAHRHRRYGAGMIYLKLRQAGERVNHKRVDRLYALEKLQVRRRRRKKVAMSERQPLVRPEAANEVWWSGQWISYSIGWPVAGRSNAWRSSTMPHTRSAG